MKAASLTQPYGTLIALGAKPIETRSWKTAYRGQLAIHAAKGFPKWAHELCARSPFSEALYDLPGFHEQHCQKADWKALPTGCIVATCRLVDCVPTETVLYEPKVPFGEYWQQDGRVYAGYETWCFGDFAPGRFAWLLADIQALPEPIPAKGALGLWNWEPNHA